MLEQSQVNFCCWISKIPVMVNIHVSGDPTIFTGNRLLLRVSLLVINLYN